MGDKGGVSVVRVCVAVTLTHKEEKGVRAEGPCTQRERLGDLERHTNSAQRRTTHAVWWDLLKPERSPGFHFLRWKKRLPMVTVREVCCLWLNVACNTCQ